MAEVWTPMASAASLWADTAEPLPAFPELAGRGAGRRRHHRRGLYGAVGRASYREERPCRRSCSKPTIPAGARAAAMAASSPPNSGSRSATSTRPMAAPWRDACTRSRMSRSTSSRNWCPNSASQSARLTRSGQVKAAHNQATLKAAIDEAEWMKREMGDTDVRILDAHQVREETGSRGFVGGVLNPGSGGIHPLNYLHGLAEGRCAARCADLPGKPCARDSGATARALSPRRPAAACARVRSIIATNCYSDLTIGDGAAAAHAGAVPQRYHRHRTAAAEPRRQPDADGANLHRDQAHDALVPHGRRSRHLRRPRRLRQAGFWKPPSTRCARPWSASSPSWRMFRWRFAWSGLVGMTLDSVPHVGRSMTAPCYSVGYNGAGVAMSSLMGRYLARLRARRGGRSRPARCAPRQDHSILSAA